MAEVSEEVKIVYKRAPLSEDGQLRNNSRYKFKSPERMILLGQPLMGKTFSMVNEPKFLIMDCDKELSNYPDCMNFSRVKQTKKKETFYIIDEDIVIPGAIYELVQEVRLANKMVKFEHYMEKLEEVEDPEEKKRIFAGLRKMIKSMPFPVVVTDSITSLQKLNYRAALYGYNSKVKPESRRTHIRLVDQYGGVNYIRPNFYGLLAFIETASPFTIYNAHPREKKNIVDKAPEDLVPMDISLDGILSNTITNGMAAVGIFYRNKDGCFIDFQKRAETDIGARPAHLRNKVVKISELQTDNQAATEQLPDRYWKLIFPELYN